MSVRAVIFDMDGLMLDTEPIYKRAWQGAAHELGYALDDDTFHSFSGSSDQDAEAALFRGLGSDFPLARFRTLWPAALESEIRTHGVVAKPGVRNLLATLSDRQVPRAVATSSPTARADLVLRAAEVSSHFGVVVTCEDVDAGKPAPDIFLEAASRLSIPPDQCVALEDSDVGAEAAVRAGMQVVVIPDQRAPSARTVEVATAVHENLEAAFPTLARLLGL